MANNGRPTLFVLLSITIMVSTAPLAVAVPEWHTISIGTVLVSGTLLPYGGCRYPVTSQEISFTAAEVNSFRQGGMKQVERTLSLSSTPACQLVVAGKVENSSNSPPPSPDPDLLGAVPEDTTGFLGGGGETSLQETECDFAKAKLWTHSVFGAGDPLTTKWGILQYCFTGNAGEATSPGSEGYCKVHAPHNFVIDSCIRNEYVAGPGDTVTRKATGTFHQDVTNYWPHQLADRERAWYDGSFLCTYWHGGDMPSNVGETCKWWD